MARCPFAEWKPLPQNATQPAIKPNAFAVHTAVDAATTTSLWNWQASPGAGGAESHFYVAKDGRVEQYMDTEIKADAQFSGNSHVISCETWDGAASSGHVGPLNDAQVSSVIRLADWCCTVHGIPRLQIPSPGGAGIGWHSLFKEWNRDAHACPGDAKVAQVTATIIPALNKRPPAAAGKKVYDMVFWAYKNPDGTFSPEFAVMGDVSVPQLCKKRPVAAASDAQFIVDSGLAEKGPDGRRVIVIKDKATVDGVPNA